MFVTDSCGNNIFVVYMTFAFKATDVHEAFMLRCRNPFSCLPSHLNSADNVHFSINCSRCTVHSNKVLKAPRKSSDILALYKSDYYYY